MTDAQTGGTVECAEQLRKWVLSVRTKFGLGGPSNNDNEYWHGYKECLADVERLAERWEAAQLGRGV